MGAKPSAWRQMIGKIRRFWLSLFGRRYIRAQQELRTGSCRGCGNCCKLFWRCPFLTQEMRCSIYGRTRPAACVHFPIDARDIADAGGECGFSFSIEAGEPAKRPRRRQTERQQVG